MQLALRSERSAQSTDRTLSRPDGGGTHSGAPSFLPSRPIVSMSPRPGGGEDKTKKKEYNM